MIAFAAAFRLQMKVILKLQDLSRDSTPQTGTPRLEKYNRHMAHFQQFFAGGLFADLFRQWRRAILWVVLSYLSRFAHLAKISLTYPAALHW